MDIDVYLWTHRHIHIVYLDNDTSFYFSVFSILIYYYVFSVGSWVLTISSSFIDLLGG